MELSLPGRPQSNGVAERAVRKVLEGVRSLLDASGLPLAFWAYAALHFCHSHNIEMIDGDSAWNRRHGKGHFSGLQVPFGAKVEFKPAPTQSQKRTKFETKSMPGVFLGYKLQQGGYGETTTSSCLWSDSCV